MVMLSPRNVLSAILSRSVRYESLRPGENEETHGGTPTRGCCCCANISMLAMPFPFEPFTVREIQS